MALEFDRFDEYVEQSLNDRFGTSFRRLIFCLGFVQIRGRCIRLMSNKKDRNFYENSQFLPHLNKVLAWIFELKSFKRWEIIVLRWLWRHIGDQVLGLQRSGYTSLNDGPLSVDHSLE